MNNIAKNTVEVTDARGRKITLEKPSLLAHSKLVRAVGPGASGNLAYMQIVFPLIYIVAIDGKPERSPKNLEQIDALIDRLDADGMEAVAKGIMEHFDNTESVGDAAPP